MSTSALTNDSLHSDSVSPQAAGRAADGGPAWDPLLYASPFHQSGQLDAASSVEIYHRLLLTRQRIDWELQLLSNNFGSQWPPQWQQNAMNYRICMCRKLGQQ